MRIFHQLQGSLFTQETCYNVQWIGCLDMLRVFSFLLFVFFFQLPTDDTVTTINDFFS